MQPKSLRRRLAGFVSKLKAKTAHEDSSGVTKPNFRTCTKTLGDSRDAKKQDDETKKLSGLDVTERSHVTHHRHTSSFFWLCSPVKRAHKTVQVIVLCLIRRLEQLYLSLLAFWSCFVLSVLVLSHTR